MKLKNPISWPLKLVQVSLLLLCLLGDINWASAQIQRVPEYRNFTIEDGLSNGNFLFHLMQDHQGYLWTAHGNGLDRFDGYDFKHFDVSNGLSDRMALRVIQGADNRIWVLTYSGKVFYLDGDTIIDQPLPEGLISVTGKGRTYNWHTEDGKTFYMGTGGKGFCIWDLDEGYRLPLDKDSSFHGGGVVLVGNEETPLGFTRSDLKNSGTPPRIGLFNEEGQLIFSFPTKVPKALAYRQIKAARKANGNYLLSWGTYLYEFTNKELLHTWELDYQITAIIKDKNGGIWIGFEGIGIQYYPSGDIADGEVHRILEGKTFHHLIEDYEGGIWGSTTFSGLYYIANPEILYHEPPDTSVPYYQVGAMDIYKDVMYTATFSGDLRIIKGDSVEEIPIRPEASVRDRQTSDLKWDSTYGHLLLISQGGLIIYDTTGEFRMVNLPDSILRYHHSREISPGRYGSYNWVLWKNCAMKVEGEEVLEVIKPFPEIMYALTEGENGELWLGGDTQLWQYKNGELIPWGEHHPLFKQRIGALSWYDGDLWVSGMSTGIGVYTADKKILQMGGMGEFKTLGEVIKDGENYWVYAGRKLYCLNRHPDSISIKSESWFSYERTPQAYAILKSGDSIFISTAKGIATIPISDHKGNQTVPKVHLTGVKINNQDTILQDNYRLSHDQNHVSIYFHSNTFTSKKRPQYRYRLLGFDTTWNYTGNRSVQFLSLAPGNYTFEAESRSYDGVWSEVPASASFTILPPFWATWWFYSLIGLSLLGFVWLLFRYRVNLIRKRAERQSEQWKLQQRITSLELKALRAQMNPHFTFNTINAIQHYITSRDTNRAQDYLAKFALLVRTILNHSNREFIRLDEELEALKLYLELEAMRFEERFGFEIKIGDEVDPTYVRIPPMLIQPHAENAVWHGLMNKVGGGKLELMLSLKGEELLCRIEDNGIGREAAEVYKKGRSQVHRSLGTAINRERLELMHQKINKTVKQEITDLYHPDGSPAGTRVEFTIPYQ